MLPAALIGVAALSGCVTRYYEVTDLSTGTVYHTTSDMADRYEYSGAIRFIDGASDAEITLLNSKVVPISKEDYDQAIVVSSPRSGSN